MDAKKRELRDQLLEPLIEHIHDVSAYVRGKALQLWHKLCTKKAIPLSLQHKVLNLTTKRLHDKSCNVRKNAIQLLIVLIQGNPYAARLPLEELESKLKTEQSKLDELVKERDKDKPKKPVIDPSKCGPSKEELFTAMEPEILVAIAEVLGCAESFNDSVSEDVGSQIIRALDKADYKKAVRLWLTQEEAQEEDELEQDDVLNQLKELYVGDEVVDREEVDRMVMEAVKEEERMEEAAVEVEDSPQLAKQQMMVHYLTDSVLFARSVHAAIPIVCQLLYSKQTSDILEAVNFFVTAFEFDVLDAMEGVRRMLSLVWSTEADVKKAVISAYKQLYMTMEGSSKKNAVQVVSNLTALILCSNQGELASLEELVSLCVQSGDLPKPCIQVMWERFSMAVPETSEEESRAALFLLSMAASAEVQIVSSNVNVLVSVGLGDRGLADFRLAHLTCTALLKLAPTRVQADR